MSREQDMQRVSDTYRDIAQESTPAHLDERIIAMAGREARTRYGLARAWVRPVAWAATIGLSFAFILEMTYFSEDAPPREIAVPERVDADLAEGAEPAPQEAPFKRAPSAVVAAPEIRTGERLREAEERADEAATSRAEEFAATPAYSERAAALYADDVDVCDAEARRSAETWYRCVLALRERGLDDAARSELDALKEAFPDFREPVSE